MKLSNFENIINKNKHRIGVCFFILLSLSILFSINGINGFMSGHLGWAGPDLLSTARNLDHTGFFLARLVSPEGVVEAYNHHPPLSFWALNFISHLSSDITTALSDYYWFSGVITIAGWALLYFLLIQKQQNPLSIAFGIIAVSTAPMFVTYRAIPTFDAYSIFVSSLLLGIFSSLISQQVTLSKKYAIFICFGFALTIAISWYSVPIIAVGLLYIIFKNLKNNRFRNQILLLSTSTGLFFVSLWGWILLSSFIQTKSFEEV